MVVVRLSTRHTALLAGIRADGEKIFRPLTVAGAALVRSVRAESPLSTNDLPPASR